MTRFRTAPIQLVLFVLIAAPAFGSEAEDYLHLAHQAYTARQWEQAIELYSKAIDAEPDRPEFYFQRAIAFDMLDRVDEAIADYERTLQLVPDYYLAMEYLAKLYVARGEHERALDLYDAALKLVRDAKWRSIVRHWISDTKKAMKKARKHSREKKSGTRAKARSLY
jgi:tetratricopeptide (TPR) repeat protein